MRLKKHTKGSVFTLLGLLLAMIIVLFLANSLIKMYFKKGSLNYSVDNSVPSNFIDTSSPTTIINSTKQKMEDINQRAIDRVKELEESVQ